MILLDVNILVYAHREDAPNHALFRNWLQEVIEADGLFGVTDLAFSGFLRIVTHPRIFSPPSPLDTALAFIHDIRSAANYVEVHPGARHWAIFESLCRTTQIRGNLIPDAYFAAIAIESDCEWITTDSDYARFPQLRRRHPLTS